jgi:murein DD-endopeptidase MepM/ murein hydrolase activator NlpD
LGITAVILFGVLIYTSCCLISNTPSNNKETLAYNLDDIKKAENQPFDLFLDDIQNAKIESPDFVLIQKNSLISSCPPVMVSAQSLGTIAGEDEPATRKEVIEYTVQAGDNLLKIAENFNISLNTILWANNLTSSAKLKEGQKLIILPVSGVIHYVASGDTISQVALKYKAEADKIISFNELADEKDIAFGDILIIPDGTMPASRPASTYTETPIANSYFIIPTDGRISQGLHWYNAIDFANECSSPIYAAAAGQVQKVKYGYNQGAGNYIKILHSNGVVTMYGHVASSIVNPGDQVSQGQIIGYVGGKPGMAGAGRSTGCHVHFEVIGARNPFGR